jgi:electron transport complex protein RnfC
MKVYKFQRGGLTYEDRSAPSAAKLSLAFLPAVSVVALRQHSGAPSSPVVRTGDSVREGELLARSLGAGEANVHSPMPGVVARVASWNILSESQPPLKNDAFVIKFHGAFEILGRKAPRHEWQNRSPFELRAAISEAGIVEMSGSGLPLETLFAEALKADAPRTLVVRCVFDDPWLAADLALCSERTKAVAEGAFIAARAAGAEQVVFAVSSNHYDIGKMLLEASAEFLAMFTTAAADFGETTALVAVGSRYPQRAERELEQALRSYEKTRIKPLGALLMVGPAAIAAVHDAVVVGEPLISRYVAVGGSAVRNPSIVHARIGIRLGELFEQCGGFKKAPSRIGVGSKLLGHEIASLDEPLTKITFAIFADSAPMHSVSALLQKGLGGWNKLKKAAVFDRACINCGLCRNVCPAGLDPEGLFWQISSGRGGEIFSYLAAECNSCACCELVCPSRLPLCTVIKRHSSGAALED